MASHATFRTAVLGRQLLGFAAAGATGAAGLSLLAIDAAADKPKLPGALDPQDFKAFKIIAKEKLTHDTFLYRFELPNNQLSGIHVASCLVTRAMLKDKPEDPQPKPVVRPYTPTTQPHVRGHLDLVIKVYNEGKMSKHIGSLNVGDSLEMKGPIPKYPYSPNIKKHIACVAGGTGITPMLQVIEAGLSNPEDKTSFTLVYGSRTPGDIILRGRIDALAKAHPDRLKVVYTVDRRGWGGLLWNGRVGFISKDLLAKTLPPPAPDTLVMVCGPPGMMEAVSGNKAKDYTQGELKGALKDLGYTSSHVFKF